MSRRTREVHNLTSLLDALESKTIGDGAATVTVRDILQLIGRRAYGPLLLIVGLIAISPATIIPGATWAFATLTLIIAIQLLFHRKTPWLPRSALNMTLSEEKLGKFVKGARPTAKFIDTIVRPRLQFLAQAPAVLLVALLIIAAALITYPLGLIPVLPLIPGVAIVLFGLGLTVRDGILLSLGAIVMAAATWLLYTRMF